jgi:RNA polymerase sigma-32 factor
VARELDVRAQDVIEMETRMAGGDLSLEGHVNDDGEETYAPIAYLEDTESEPTRILERRGNDWMQSEGVRLALATLDARSRRIIEARWLAENDDGSVGSATLHDLADEFGVSAERIRQLEVKALRKMRDALQAEAVQ